MFETSSSVMADCRYVKVPSCEDAREVQQSANVPTLGVLRLKQRDTLDFGIDLTDWLGANHSPAINAVTWAVAADSPKTPVLGASSFDKDGICAVAVTCGVGALPGDTYFLEATILLDPTMAVQGVPALPARTIVRRITVVVSKG